jgi:hypothetical protein
VFIEPEKEREKPRAANGRESWVNLRDISMKTQAVKIGRRGVTIQYSSAGFAKKK